jgi:hypothetical protein
MNITLELFIFGALIVVVAYMALGTAAIMFWSHFEKKCKKLTMRIRNMRKKLGGHDG